MKHTLFVSGLALAWPVRSSALVPTNHAGLAPPSLEARTWKRASPEAPNGYAPSVVDCPATRPSIRSADGLSAAETSWLQKRRPKTVDAMRELLVRFNIPDFDAGQWVDKHRSNTSALPNIAIAFSGGGYRALLNGAGALAAFDQRTPGATEAGHLGGLLQASTYAAGLSGGGWMLGSIFANNFSAVQSIVDANHIWQFQNSLLRGPPTGSGHSTVLSTADYFTDIVRDVKGKIESPAGEFNASLTDYYGRGLSFQLIDAANGAPAYTFSSIQDDADFGSGNAPMPILVADERAPGQTIISLNATVFEFNPFEMGSFDPTLYAFAPLRYLGSNFSGGELASSQACVAGFDNLGFIMGTSSSLFNQILSRVDTMTGIPSLAKKAIESVLTKLGKESDDIADYTPNPFMGYRQDSNPSASQQRLTLVDGGEDLQNIPLQPLIQPMRHVDVIFAVDSSADTVEADNPSKNWPNGTALVATYQRANTAIMNRTSFPYIPGQDTMVALGLNNRPVFFGCNSSNVTQGDNIPPLVVYLPNTPYVFWSNQSTFDKLEYTLAERAAMIQNGYNVATQGNSTRQGASNWPTCVGCAILARSLERNGESIPSACQQCFTNYCWNGTVVDKAAPYKPEMILTQIKVARSVHNKVPRWFLAVAGAWATWLTR